MLGRAVPGVVRPWVEELGRIYSGVDRHYHNMGHIDACLALVEELRGEFLDVEAAEVAVWFHDVIYDARRGDNEERSAAFAEERLRQSGMGAERVRRVVELILATRHKGVPGDGDGRLVVDIDLAILGAEWEVFEAYEMGVRREYGHLRDEVFWPGRGAFLEGLLGRGRIYGTEILEGRLEGRARVNVLRSIERVRGRGQC